MKNPLSNSKISRRNTLKGAAAIAAAGTAGACANASPSSANLDSMSGFEPLPDWLNLLHTSEKGDRDSRPRIEGDLPRNLRGSLYRNGPGLFERGGSRVKHLLDGDGLVQKLNFSDRGVRYQNKFVRTKKFVLEEKSGKREFSTWTTPKSSNLFSNLGGGITESQAGVTVYPVYDKILARDEIGPSYQIDPENLDTLGTVPVGNDLDDVLFKAHIRFDPDSGESAFVGTRFGSRMQIHATIYKPDMQHKTQFSFMSPRQVYFHDFFMTKNHLIVYLHPCFFSPFPFLLGMKSFVESLKWDKQNATLIAVVPRNGGEPRFFDAPASFVWHTLNAYERGNEIVTDFVSYDEPDHFIGENAMMSNIMYGRSGNDNSPGKIRRHVIDLATNRVGETILDEQGNEFPMMDWRVMTKRHKVGYFAFTGDNAKFHSGLKRVDFDSGAVQNFDFGNMVQVGEPVFVPKPGGRVDEGWLITECIDGHSKTSFFALFDAQTIDQGPISKLWLDHHVPISFHGAWENWNI